MSGNLLPYKVLLTRPLSQSQRTAQTLLDRGGGCWLPLIHPLLEIYPQPWAQPTEVPVAFILTSINAIGSLSGQNIRIPIYTVGSATAEAVQALGFIHVKTAARDAKTLLDMIETDCLPREEEGGEVWPPLLDPKGLFIHLSGDVVTIDIAEELQKKGYRAERHCVYRTAELTTAPIDTTQQIMAALVYSSRSMDVLNRAIPHDSDAASIDLVVLSGAIADKAGARWRSVHIAPHPNEDSLLDTLQGLLRFS